MFQKSYPKVSFGIQLLSCFVLITTLAKPALLVGHQPMSNRSADSENSNSNEKYSSDQIKVWINQLGDEEFKTRVLAQKHLIKVGGPAIPELQKHVIHDDPELQVRVRQILMHLALNGDEKTAKRVLDILPPKEAASVESTLNMIVIKHWIKEGRVEEVTRDGDGHITFVFFSRKSLVDDAVFARLKHLKSLRQIKSDTKHITDAGLLHLKGIDSMLQLSLRHSKITDTGLAHLQEMSSLQQLDLTGTSITDEGIAHLSAIKSLSSLSLALCTKITDAGVAHLKDLKSLNSLNLHRTRITDKGLIPLIELGSLNSLNFHSTDITDVGLVHLGNITSLKRLNLFNTKVTDAGLVHLKKLKSLSSLTLSGKKISDAGLQHLKDLKLIDDLYLYKTSITRQGYWTLRKSLPNMKHKPYPSIFGTTP